MRGKLASACALIAFWIAMTGVHVSGEGVGIAVGDYWEYTFGGDIEGMTMDGTMMQEVVDIDSDVFVLSQTASAEVSGSFDTITISGDMTMDGTSHRQVSDFSMVSDSYVMTISMSGTGFSMDMSMGFETSYSPAADDYIGDEVLVVGETFTTSNSVTMDTWVEVLGMNESQTTTMDVDLAMEIVDANVSVTTAAGTFNCYKVEFTETVDDQTSTLVYYYSDEVGNYVKMVGADESLLFGLPNVELKSYSYEAGGESAGILDGPTTLILIIVVIAAVVIIALALVMRSRKRAQVPPMIPPQEMPPQPPQVPPPPPPAQ